MLSKLTNNKLVLVWTIATVKTRILHDLVDFLSKIMEIFFLN